MYATRSWLTYSLNQQGFTCSEEPPTNARPKLRQAQHELISYYYQHHMDLQRVGYGLEDDILLTSAPTVREKRFCFPVGWPLPHLIGQPTTWPSRSMSPFVSQHFICTPRTEARLPDSLELVRTNRDYFRLRQLPMLFQRACNANLPRKAFPIDQPSAPSLHVVPGKKKQN